MIYGKIGVSILNGKLSIFIEKITCSHDNLSVKSTSTTLLLI